MAEEGGGYTKFDGEDIPGDEREGKYGKNCWMRRRGGKSTRSAEVSKVFVGIWSIEAAKVTVVVAVHQPKRGGGVHLDRGVVVGWKRGREGRGKEYEAE